MAKATSRGFWVVALGCAGALGCGDDSGSSGVTGSKVLTELTTEDNEMLCLFYEQLTKSSLGTEEQYCTGSGLSGAEDAEQCEGYKQECLDEDYYSSDLNEDWGCKQNGLITEEIQGPCTATVNDVEACIREDVERDTGRGKKYTCEDAADLYGDEDESESVGPRCEKVFTKCPGADF